MPPFPPPAAEEPLPVALAGIFLSSSSPARFGVPLEAAEAVNEEVVEATPAEEASFPLDGGVDGGRDATAAVGAAPLPLGVGLAPAATSSWYAFPLLF